MVYVTPLFGAIFGLMYTFLSADVIRRRLKNNVSLGYEQNEDLQVAIRVHGNFIEYVPLCLILFFLLESLTLSSNLTFWLGCVLLISRCSHVYGMKGRATKLIFRKLGMLGTFSVILISSLAILWVYLPVSI